MEKVKTMIVFGTRPDTIKLAPLMNECISDEAFDVLLCNTGQHDSEVAMNILNFFDVHGKIVNLETMVQGQTLNHITQHVVFGVDQAMQMFKPDIMIVQGDTTSAMAAAMAGFNNGVMVAHVEAGLRTGKIDDPFPEEMNRITIDRLSSIMFAPTKLGYSNLSNEDLKNKYIVGNTSVDSLKYCCDKIAETRFRPALNIYNESKKYVFVTIHRRESFGKPILDIISAINSLARKHRDLNFVWPVHPNPNISPVVKNNVKEKNISLYDPFSYAESIFMIKNSLAVITDSGGVQEDATSFAIPTIIARKNTDRVGHIEIASSKKPRTDHSLFFKDKYFVSGTKTDDIIKYFEIVYNSKLKKQQGRIYHVYGDGLASKRIAYLIKQLFGMPAKVVEPLSFSYDTCWD